MNSDKLYNPPSTLGKTLTVAFLFAFLGFLDASYLAASHWLGELPKCLITEGCDTVLTSKYAVWNGFPVSFFGAILYSGEMLILTALRTSFSRKLLYTGIGFGGAGFAASLYFVYLQKFVIGAYCTYCLVSAAISTLLFIFWLFIAFVADRNARHILNV